MKKIISLITLLALLAAPVGALAENWWSDIGPAAGAQTPEPTPEPTAEPTQKPKLNLNGLFGGLLGTDKPQPEETAEPEPTADPEGYDDSEEGDGYWENVLYDYYVADITGQPYGGESQYARVGNWTVAYGYCDDHYCVFGWNENTREHHILAETVVSNIVPAGDVFAYYGEVKKGKFGWLIRNPNEDKPVSLSLNELNSVFWSDEDYLYYFTYGKGTGTTYYRMNHQGKNKKQLGKLNGRAIAMMPDGGVVVFNSSKNRVQIFKDGKHETIYEPGDEIQNVISTGREIWVVHRDYLGRLKDGKLDFQFPGSLRTYAATTDQIIAVLDDGSIQHNVVMLNDAYGAYALVGKVVAQESLTAEVTPGWYNRIVVWGPRESLEFYTPYSGLWLPYGYHDLESAKAAGYQEYVGEPEDGYAEEGRVERRISEKLLLGEEADILAEAEERGIYATHDRDGMYSYYMDYAQYDALLEERRQGLVGLLGIMTMLGDDPTVKSYEANEDYSRITLRVNSGLLESDTTFLVMLSVVALSAPAYQALLREDEHPVSVITVVDDATGKEISVFNAPDDFL